MPAGPGRRPPTHFPRPASSCHGAVYNTSYGISYGVVLPALFIARAIPKNNAVTNGLIDGARAAFDAIGGKTADAVSEPTP